MDSTNTTLDMLFAQLGLDTTDAGIENFVRTHAPLDGAVRIADAPFWSPSQAAFLEESLQQDAEWAIVVGQLDALLRENE